MNSIINDPLVIMEFPVSGSADRDSVVRALIDSRSNIESTFNNNEYLMLDLTHQEIIGIKSTAHLGKMKVGDLPALNCIVSNSDRYKESKMMVLGNVSTIYNHLCS